MEFVGSKRGVTTTQKPSTILVAMISISVALVPTVCLSDYVPREGFVTLQFSDSHDLDYTGIFPLLEAHGLKASFCYITEVSDLGIENDAWMMQEIYLAGHEVQDHTTRHDYMWATFVDTLDDGVRDLIPYTFADVATWDSLCERSLFILDSLGMDVVGWGHPGYGDVTTIPGHPSWTWQGGPNDSLYELIATKYQYALLGSGASPYTAHLNLRGHNCPERYPFFDIPFITVDRFGAEEIKTGMADAAASGLWYVAQMHVWKEIRVAKAESLMEWLDSAGIDVLRCVEGWQRIAYGEPDPLPNQFPQARMLVDRDGNNKPDGFSGLCAWDTSSASPVESTYCLIMYGDTEFYCYGPEVGRNALSLWIRSASCNTGVRVIWVAFDFDRTVLASGYNTFHPDTAWVRVDSTVCPNMTIDVADEVDQIKIIVRPLECDSISMAYPELILLPNAGVETGEKGAGGIQRLMVRPNPATCGEAVRITPARNVILYDVMGRHVLTPNPSADGDALVIDTSPLAPGVYFIRCEHMREDGTHLIVLP
jgi:hypothetical protein